MDFYLGADVAGLSWGIPVMVSHGRLRTRKRLPRATAPWICDSRGFSELSQHGRWTTGAREYAEALLRYSVRPGRLAWASPQDWMCEPFILAKTGKTVAMHQQLTTESTLLLRSILAGRVHIIPVLQGWRLIDYLAHDELYAAHGIDLRAEPVVGLGSVCRRQATGEIHDIVSVMESRGIRCHGFGVKTAAIAAVGPLLTSADSFAWSYGGRRAKHCDHGLTDHAANCRNCALAWRERVLSQLGYVQMMLPMFGADAP